MSIVALFQRILSPGCSWCFRCKRPWSFVRGHVTQYDSCNGCFPLCESCWNSLNPGERLPYYWELWEDWQSRGSNIEWEIIEAACLSEETICQ